VLTPSKISRCQRTTCSADRLDDVTCPTMGQVTLVIVVSDKSAC
jgi:hypothetical protein